MCYQLRRLGADHAVAQLLVRNLDDDLVRRLKIRAVAAGRSAEAEHRLILEQALRPDVEAFKERARQLRERTKGRCTVDSTEIIREFRDRGNPYPDQDD
jgi:plasmid stability protein